jgi:hypothetical protein
MVAHQVIETIISDDYGKFISGVGELQNISIQKEGRFGLHVVTSPRFICTLQMSRGSDPPSEAKIFVKNRGNVQQEYEHMRLLWSEHYCRADQYQIPEPLYLAEKHELLFLRFWPGDSFLRMYYRSLAEGRPRRHELAVSCARRAAQWLVDFQSIHSSGEEREAPSELLDFDGRLAAMTQLNPGLRRRIGDKLRGLQRSLPALPDTYVHDQYLFRNILFNEEKICVIDFPHFRIGWPLYDFFTFYTGLERLKQYPLFPRVLVDSMKDAFARAYFAERGIRYDHKDLENLWAFFITGYVSQRYRNRTIGRVREIVNDSFIRKMYDRLGEWSKT